MSLAKILWVDDEIESLESQKRFLEAKGYAVTMLSNGPDALEFLRAQPVDVVLLDETMPGMTGLETLSRIKEQDAHIPVIMITKNETENLMDEAIGAQISDYLIKPVNPHQVLSSLKKIIDNRRLVAEKTTSDYQQQFRQLFMALNSDPDHAGWMDIYRRLAYWEMAMERSDSPEMQDVHQSHKNDANAEFFKFISRHYASWVDPRLQDEAPVMSHTLFRRLILPHIEKGRPTLWLLIDNLRYDQWTAIEPVFAEIFRIVQEDMFYSILPTATQYARNAVFAGLLPMEIERQFPGKWKQDEDEGSKNLHEEEFFRAQLKRLRREDIRSSYHKITSHQDAQKLAEGAHNLLNFDLSIVVYNFVDMLSHARTEMEVLKELAGDERSYRSLTRSWFEHSPLLQMLRKLAEKGVSVVLSTDHGSVRVKDACKVVGDRLTTSNLRYKHGRNLDYSPQDVLAFRDPKVAGLPTPTVNSSYIFAREERFLCYPNNFNQFANYYRNSFQHGGISLEEMIVPVVRMTPR